MDKLAVLKVSETYEHTDGGKYKCTAIYDFDCQLERISDSWTFTAHGTRMTENGSIYWAYSTGGCWIDKERLESYLSNQIQSRKDASA